MSEIWKQQDEKIIKYWIFQLLYQSKELLTDWERKFIVSIDRQFINTGKISQKQQDILERIYSEKT